MRNYFLAKPFLVRRLLAKALDLGLVFWLVPLVYPWGALPALVYLFACDGIGRGRSLGKRVMRLRVIKDPSGEGCEYTDSVVRNCTVAVPVLFFLVPVVGWFLWILIGIPILAIELALMTRLDSQARLGDTMADTKVSEWVTPQRV